MHQPIPALSLAISLACASALTSPCFALPPISIGETSFAEISLRNCNPEAATNGLSREEAGHPFGFTDANGNSFPRTMFATPACTHFRLFGPDDEPTQLTESSANVGFGFVLDPEGDTVGIGPLVNVNGSMQMLVDRFHPFGMPIGSARARAALDYIFQVGVNIEAVEDQHDLDLDDLSRLIEDMESVEVPMFVNARADARTEPDVELFDAVRLVAGATVKVTEVGSSTPLFPPVEASADAFAPTITPVATFEGIVNFKTGVPYNVHMLASGEAIDGKHDGKQLQFFASADPHFAIDKEGLRTKLLDIGIDLPSPEQFYQIRFSPDIEFGIANFVPEPATSILAVCWMTVLICGIRAHRS